MTTDRSGDDEWDRARSSSVNLVFSEAETIFCKLLERVYIRAPCNRVSLIISTTTCVNARDRLAECLDDGRGWHRTDVQTMAKHRIGISRSDCDLSSGHIESYGYRIARFVRKSADARPLSYFLYDLPLRLHICDCFETGRTTGCTTGAAIKTYLRLCKIYRAIHRGRSRLIAWLDATSRSRSCD